MMTINGVLETCLYSENLNAAESFYTGVLGLKLVSAENGRHLFLKCGRGMLLIFNPEHTSREQTFVNGSPVPLHGSKGSGHLALSIDDDKHEDWESRLEKHGVEIESKVEWPNGCKSIYFRDPDGNSLEIVSEGLWDLQEIKS